MDVINEVEVIEKDIEDVETTVTIFNVIQYMVHSNQL